MELIKPPFQPESFFQYSHYLKERDRWLNEQYVGKRIVFNCDLVDISGNTRHIKGTEVEIVEVKCDCFKVSKDDEGIVEGTIFKPSCFDDK
jgi:hypothetical protein